MADKPASTSSKGEVVDSYPTEDEAWDVAHDCARLLKAKGLASEMGVTVRKAGRGAWWVVLVKRDATPAR